MMSSILNLRDIMNKLFKITENLEFEVLNGNLSNLSYNKLCYDTRKIENDDLFVCLEGARFDAHSVISEIVEKGAKVIIVDKNNNFIKDKFEKIKNSIPNINKVLVLAVENTRVALAILSSNYFGRPSEKLKIIGITGTKGKTTTAFMIKSILEEAGHKVGMIGTIGIFYGDEHIITDNTTPESYILNEYFKKMVDIGIEYVVMEVSSQSLKWHRVCGIKFYYAVWTNIMPEHIGENEHTDYDDYIKSKLKIFENAENALVNVDTNDYDRVIDKIKRCKCKLFEKKINRNFNLKIPGAHNLENASLAYEFGKSLNIDDDIIVRALEKTVVPGRIEVVHKDDDTTIIVDFSYEDNGAKRFLDTIRKENPKRIVTVFGCGGNRSKDRRFGMGEVCGKMADFVILTADNSRFEKTRDIIKDIEKTLTKYKVENDLENGYVIIEDRREAIEFAIKNRKPGDVICVMGKGHEPFMEMNGKQVPFLDRQVILDIIDELQ